MRFLAISIVVVICSFAFAGCTRQSTVTPQFLLDHGFSHSATDPTLYELKNVTVGEAAQRLGFSPKDMTHGTNNPPDQDIRLVVVRDYEFAVLSNPQTSGNAQTTLDNTNAMCTVEARLIPLLHRATTK
jgi:hypothetical protein